MCALLVVLAPAIAAFAQDAASPARRHAQVIAHGVMTMPAAEMAWRLGTRQALAAAKTVAEERAAGFVIAGDAPLLLTDATGEVVSRLDPGAAVWTDADQGRAVVSAAGRTSYLEIALVAAGTPLEQADAATTGPFAVPAGTAFDVDLIRDVVARGEESVIPASTMPMLLVVTGGKVFVDHGDNAIDEVAQGSFAQVAGDVVVSGASRTPATFVVARIGAQTVERVPLRATKGTPTASEAPPVIATPIGELAREATIHIHAFFCPPAYAKTEFAIVCREPASEIAFSVERRGKTVLSHLTDATGQTTMADVKAGNVTLLAGLPASGAFSEIHCRARSGVETHATSGSNRVSLSLLSGDDLSCDWYIVATDERLMLPSLSVAIRACPEGMTPTRFRPRSCATMAPGTSLTLRDAESGKPFEASMSRPDRWRWDGLDRTAYTLDVAALPAGFAGSALDGNLCCGKEHDFTIAQPRQRRKLTRTLYLFPPDVPRDRSLTVAIRACPPGMTAETLVAERCEPAPAGTTLSLQERGIDLGVAAVASDAWQWTGLGALPYILRVNALPRGYTAFQLDDGCCDSETDIALDLATGPPQAEHTLYLLTPATADAESDADNDGLLDAREAGLGTQPFLPDSDGDGLGDGDEVDFYGTDPHRADSDGDGLSDTEEVQAYGANPLLADTDGDGLSDSNEVAAGSDPLDFASTPTTPTVVPAATPLLATPPATPAPLTTPEGDACTSCAAGMAYDPMT